MITFASHSARVQDILLNNLSIATENKKEQHLLLGMP